MERAKRELGLGRRVPTGAAVATFIRFYGAEVFANGQIVWPWYLYLTRWMPAAIASETIASSTAVSLGAGGLFDGKSFREAMRKIQDEIYRER